MKKKWIAVLLLAAMTWNLTACGSSTETSTTEESSSASSATDAAIDGTAFPTFQAKDLDGNDVDSSIFSQHAVTVVNFWFNGCSPCVEELPALNELNESLKAQGGAVIGVNTDSLDGNEDGIAEAKQILEKQGVDYQNIYFDSSSEAGQYASNIMAFPTTIFVDRNGTIIGEPILGGMDNEEVREQVQKTIDEIVANDTKQ